MNEFKTGLGPVADATGTPPTIDELRNRRARRTGRRLAMASAVSALLVVVVAASIASGGRQQPSDVRTGQHGSTSTVAAANSGTTHDRSDGHRGHGVTSTTSTTAVPIVVPGAPTGTGNPTTPSTTSTTSTTTVVPAATEPGAPEIGVAKAGPTIVGTGFWGTESTTDTGGKGSALVRWSPPAFDGGSPITKYYVQGTYVGGEPSSFCWAPAGATSCLVNGIYAEKPMYFQVMAYNATGNGPASRPSNAVTTPKTAPNVPTLAIPQVGMPDRATAGDRNASMTWGEPIYNGGSPITGYVVQSYKSDGSTGPTCTTGPSARGCTVTGLTNGTTYTFRVRAVNAIGTGDPSSVSNAVTPSAT